ncbi:MAG: ribosome-binding factor A [Gammaproteobacteria bacterium RIFCSPHIGHO2_12_FULL_38_14]|nr:MAG: ribosome-binding factor A [Gammaproteobacteria bacterium RIFCSPHIGHO2_12_FULL_38_14]
MKRGFLRKERVADAIQKALARLLLKEMHDQRFHLVTITGVELSKDLSYAKIYVSVLVDEEDIQSLIQTLNLASKSLRYHLAREVKLRIVPELKFVYDESTARGFRISKLIDDAAKKSKKKD